MASAFSARPCPSRQTITAASAITGMGNWFQLASPNDPISQNSTACVACGLPRKIR